MNKFKEYLNPGESHYPLRIFMIMMLAAYLFSVAIRMIWVGQFSDVESFFWNGQLMINTNDGYYYAEGARDILSGAAHNGLSPVTSAPSLMTAFFAAILPLSFESIILFMPAMLGSLLVVPVMLIARALKQDLLGFIAALLAGITWSYYNRTMTGYYDTDMLTIVLPTFVLWSVILAVQQNRNRYLLFTTLTMIAYQWWYAQSYSLHFAMIGMLAAYTLFFDRKNLFFYKLLLFMVIANITMPIYLKLILSVILFGVFHTYKERVNGAIIGALLGVASLIFFATGGFDPIWHQIKGYLFRDTVSAASGHALQYFNVMQTVREAGQIPFETFANRISGHTATFILSAIGYLLLILRYPVMLLGLPLLGLGYMALFGGLRFTVYAVPVSALGAAFFILLAATYLGNAFEGTKKSALKYLFITLTTALVLLPNITHIIGYKVPTVMNNSEVKVLDKLNSIASDRDYAIAWWDYGFPIRYYGGVKTMIDGAQHQGKANFPVSYALVKPQQTSAVMSRLNVEYKEANWGKPLAFMPDMMKQYNYEDPNIFLEFLTPEEIALPEKTREIYYFLPYRMLEIFPTVGYFSNIDLTTGRATSKPFMYRTTSMRDTGEMITLGNGVAINKKEGTLIFNNQVVPMDSFVVTSYDQAGKLRVQSQKLRDGASIYAVYMSDYKTMLLMDEVIYNSTYVQLFILENYDRRLFEPVVMDPSAKVYRLKI